MTEHVGQVLKALREARGLSLRALAARASTSHSQLANIEAGRRELTVKVATACDRALRTHVLAMIVNEGDPVKRRELVAGFGAMLAGVPVLTAAMSEAVRLGFSGAPASIDYDATIARHAAGLVSSPDAAYGADLLADLLAVQRVVTTGAASAEQVRAAARLAQLFGLYEGNNANLRSAFGWYATAIDLSDNSRDLDTRVWTRGRAASRGVYEGMRAQRAVSLAEEAIGLSDRPSDGLVEAHSALVHVHALTGNLDAGRQSVAAMRNTADALPVTHAGPQQRVVLFDNYLEARAGTLESASRAHERAMAHLSDLPVWRVDASIYFGLALVRHRQVDDGIAYALGAIRTVSHPDRVLTLGVADLLRVVPTGHESDNLAELRGHAYTGTAPWDTIR